MKPSPKWRAQQKASGKYFEIYASRRDLLRGRKNCKTAAQLENLEMIRYSLDSTWKHESVCSHESLDFRVSRSTSGVEYSGLIRVT